jgi:hypothetical protein
MKRAIEVGVVVVSGLLLLWPEQSLAQRQRPAMFRPGTIVAHASVGHPTAITATPLNPNFGPIRGVPGLGFDYEHLLAVGTPSRGHFGRRTGRFTSEGFNEILPLFYAEGYPFYPQPQPTVIVLQQPPPTVLFQSPSPQDQTAEVNTPRSSSAQAALQAPPPELGQFILVLRNGKVVLAVAFTINGDRLTYITREGTRLSFPLSELDVDATRQMNEVNGTMLSLPH